MIKEVVQVELPPIEIYEAVAATSSCPPQKQIMVMITELIHQTPPVTKSSPESIARFYERFVVRASRLSREAPLDCSKHLFFINIPNVTKDQKDFVDKVLAKEGDIAKECTFEWEPVKELVLKGIFEGVRALESSHITAAAEKMDICHSRKGYLLF